MSTPNPATTPWVPMWKLSSVVGNLGIASYKGAYVAGTYNNGDIVVYNGTLYMCTKNGITDAPMPWVPGGSDVILKSLLDAAGDLIVASANDTPAKLPIGASSVGQVLTRIASTPFVGWQTPIVAGTELDYAQITSSVVVTVTTEATAVDVIVGNNIVYDGSRVKIEYMIPRTLGGATAGQLSYLAVVRDTTFLGRFQTNNVPSAGAQDTFVSHGAMFDTPSAGTHQYRLKAYVSAANCTYDCGAGGPGVLVPAWMRVTKA